MSRRRDYAGKAYLERADENTLLHWCVCVGVCAFAAAVMLWPVYRLMFP